MQEHQIINQIAKLCPIRSSDITLSIGDDAAVFTTEHLSKKSMVACQDLLVENVHFKLSTHSAEDLGYKSMAVNFSDMAAMGATPVFAMVSIALPKGLTDPSWISSFYKGANLICQKYGTSIIGGDLSASPSHLFINVSVIGACHNKPILRNGAKLGDFIGLTGTLGLSHTGLRALNCESQNYPNAMSCHRRPLPRIEQSKKIAPYINSLIDVSDGLVNDLKILLNQSSHDKPNLLGAALNFEQTPFLHQETIDYCEMHLLNPIDFALYGGEDFELLFSFDQQSLANINKALIDEQWQIIGKITDSGKIFYQQNELINEVNLDKRWQHF